MRQVSWIRQSDLHILTAGRYTYTTDLRFEALHRPGSALWTLAVRAPRRNDSGLYDCQISTTPEMAVEVQFNVVGTWTGRGGGGNWCCKLLFIVVFSYSSVLTWLAILWCTAYCDLKHLVADQKEQPSPPFVPSESHPYTPTPNLIRA